MLLLDQAVEAAALSAATEPVSTSKADCLGMASITGRCPVRYPRTGDMLLSYGRNQHRADTVGRSANSAPCWDVPVRSDAREHIDSTVASSNKQSRA